jgi:hypothetical protein
MGAQALKSTAKPGERSSRHLMTLVDAIGFDTAA